MYMHQSALQPSITRAITSAPTPHCGQLLSTVTNLQKKVLDGVKALEGVRVRARVRFGARVRVRALKDVPVGLHDGLGNGFLIERANGTQVDHLKIDMLSLIIIGKATRIQSRVYSMLLELEKCRHTGSMLLTYIHTYRQTDRQTDRHILIQTYRYTDKQLCIHIFIHTYRQTYMHAYIQTDRHTHMHA